ncbi:MAG: sigma-54 dependent transcriptional regulator [Candidatus Deferrimicrobiaceae bacterium]
MKKSLLIAEDDENILELLLNVFSRPDLELHPARSGVEAMGLIDRHEMDVVLTDLVMPEGDGLEVLSHAKKSLVNCEVILMTGYGTVENAVHAMKLGAFHYITKPFKVVEVVHLVDRALEMTGVKKENIHLKKEAIGRYQFENIIGISEKVRQMLSLVSKVAASDSTILILGESGTGKELIARAIHYNSDRADRILAPVNCSAIPAELLESELFGHVRGAFTGAHTARTGRFEAAHRGTIFLDEIGEMSPPLQAKILRVLQEQSFTPVGGTKPVNVDVRVIAATNKDLEKEIAEGRFRQDLFFRLNVIPVHVPPLRERVEDIPVLAEHFIRKYAKGSGRRIQGFRADAMDALERHSWPGNVRELENLVERLVVLNRDGWFEKKDLPAAMLPRKDRDGGKSAERLRNGGLDFRKAREDFENGLIREALSLCGGNKNRAAALLGLKRTTLLEMLKRKGFHGP